MMKIEVIIRKSKLRLVKSSLLESGFSDFHFYFTRFSTISEHRFYKGVEYDAQAEERVKLSMYIDSKKVKRVVEIFQETLWDEIKL